MRFSRRVRRVRAATILLCTAGSCAWLLVTPAWSDARGARAALSPAVVASMRLVSAAIDARSCDTVWLRDEMSRLRSPREVTGSHRRQATATLRQAIKRRTSIGGPATLRKTLLVAGILARDRARSY